MTVQINGTTGVSLVQDSTITSAKITDGAIVAADLAGGTGSGNLTQYTTAVTPLILNGASVAVTHGLGFKPIEAVLEITCITAENGYSVGDTLEIYAIWNGSVIITTPVWKSATQVGFAIPATYQMFTLHKSTFGGASPTPANWSYRFRLRAA